MPASDALREHLVRVLDWEDAHVGFDKAVEGIAPDKRGMRPAGFEHSPWQLVEHLRIAQEDILDFCVNPKYEHNLKWPDEYWPKDPSPADEKTWIQSIASFERTRDELKKVARDTPDLAAPVPTGNAQQTYMRAILLASDHVAYHVGQIILVRRGLGIWP